MELRQRAFSIMTGTILYPSWPPGSIRSSYKHLPHVRGCGPRYSEILQAMNIYVLARGLLTMIVFFDTIS